MGLIKAGMGALGGTLADQWKEFFYCDSLDKDVLMVKGQKRTSRRSSNHGEDNIITNGSGIAVAFVATIYGVGFANLLLLPIGNKLKTLVLRQSRYREMLLEGLLSIAEGENPRSIELKLQGFMD